MPVTQPTRRTPISTAKGVWYFALAVVAALAGSRIYHELNAPQIPPGPVRMDRMSVRTAQSTVALNGIAGGARAGQDYIAAAEREATAPDHVAVRVSPSVACGMAPVSGAVPLRPDPTGAPPPAIRVSGVTSAQPHKDKDAATADALRVAREKLEEVLAALHAPVAVLPSDEVIRADYLDARSVAEVKPTDEEKKSWKANGLDDDRMWVRLTVSVSEEQLRGLRSKQRLHAAGWWAAAAFAVLAIGYGFFRFDSATKGHYTLALLGAALLAGGGVVAALVYFW